MAHAGLRRVALEQTDLLFGERVRLLPGLGFQAQQALVAGLEVMTQPDPAHAGGTDVDTLEPEFIGDALGAVNGLLETQLEDLLLNGFGDLIGVRILWSPALLDKSRNAADFEGLLDLIEGVTVVAHDLAGLGDVAQFLGELQQ